MIDESMVTKVIRNGTLLNLAHSSSYHGANLCSKCRETKFYGLCIGNLSDSGRTNEGSTLLIVEL